MHEVKQHTELLRAVQSQPSIPSAIARSSQEEDQVVKAELYFVLIVAEHNLSFATADHFTRLCKKMFPDSRIADLMC